MSDAIVKNINLLKSIIEDECNGILYHPFAEYRNCGCRILNATRFFYYNTIILLKYKDSANEEIINRNINILTQIKNILYMTDLVSAKEEKIKNLLKEKELNPETILELENKNIDNIYK